MISSDTPLEILIAILTFIVAIGILVAVHEFGHFWVARQLGIRVLRFSIGFGKPLWQRTAGKDPVEYVIAAIPLGGYVKLLDEREGNVPADEAHRAFNRQPVWKRIAVLLAGPAFNLMFAVAAVLGVVHGRRAGAEADHRRQCAGIDRRARRARVRRPDPAQSTARTSRRSRARRSRSSTT